MVAAVQTVVVLAGLAALVRPAAPPRRHDLVPAFVRVGAALTGPTLAVSQRVLWTIERAT